MQKKIHDVLEHLGLRDKNTHRKNKRTVTCLGLNQIEDASLLTAGRRGAFTEGINNNIRHNVD